MKEESEYYVIISKDEETVRLYTGSLNPRDYNFMLKRSQEQAAVIFNEYRISERNHKLVIQALDKIHCKPHLEVSGEVKGLITKLKGETQ